MSTRLLILVLMIPVLSHGQGTLITAQGREFVLSSFNSYRITEDGSMLDVRPCLMCMNLIPVDSVAELVSFSEEKIYHLKRLHSPTLKYAFLELITSGKVTVYRRVSKSIERGSGGVVPRRPKAWASYTEVEEYFLEKNGYLKQVLPAYGSQLRERLLLKEFVNDDAVSVREIDNANFVLGSRSLLRIVEDYNARSFEPPRVSETGGLVSFMLADDHQASAPLNVMVNGETSPLNSQMFTVRIPVSADSKVCIISGAHSKCQVIRGTRHFPEFFEVHLDKRGEDIRFRRLTSKRFSHRAGRVASAGGQ